ncbi:LysR family transcriptional regulator [Sphingomonas sp. So64.6b]|uniref:LysR family transcriptional regulator n=1 Tax=Sphingomonas sp. So64.6b TaxID=2997354 RepID=UPI001601B571|nr:LysR family transcriptional regulator [Sphingomonas sp. So64.6b]QNA84693.1 LysR family transcriptional regulator [Sphingomonas sp. So64.6b]
MKNLDLAQLRAFATIVDLRGFTAAAEALGTTQSAISMRVNRLEAVVGARLLVRTSRSVGLTAAGQALLPHARGLVTMNDAAVAELAGPPPRMRVRLAVSEHAVGPALGRTMMRLRSRWPEHQFDVEIGLSAEVRTSFDSGEADAAILRRDAQRRDGAPLFMQTLTWLAADPAIAEQRPVPLAVVRGPCAVRAAMIDALQARSIQYRICFQANSLAAVITAVREKIGVSAVGHAEQYPDLQPVALPALPTGEVVLYARLPGELRRSLEQVFGEALEL